MKKYVNATLVSLAYILSCNVYGSEEQKIIIREFNGMKKVFSRPTSIYNSSSIDSLDTDQFKDYNSSFANEDYTENDWLDEIYNVGDNKTNNEDDDMSDGEDERNRQRYKQISANNSPNVYSKDDGQKTTEINDLRRFSRTIGNALKSGTKPTDIHMSTAENKVCEERRNSVLAEIAELRRSSTPKVLEVKELKLSLDNFQSKTLNDDKLVDYQGRRTSQALIAISQNQNDNLNQNDIQEIDHKEQGNNADRALAKEKSPTTSPKMQREKIALPDNYVKKNEDIERTDKKQFYMFQAKKAFDVDTPLHTVESWPKVEAVYSQHFTSLSIFKKFAKNYIEAKAKHNNKDITKDDVKREMSSVLEIVDEHDTDDFNKVFIESINNPMEIIKRACYALYGSIPNHAHSKMQYFFRCLLSEAMTINSEELMFIKTMDVAVEEYGNNNCDFILIKQKFKDAAFRQLKAIAIRFWQEKHKEIITENDPGLALIFIRLMENTDPCGDCLNAFKNSDACMTLATQSFDDFSKIPSANMNQTDIIEDKKVSLKNSNFNKPVLLEIVNPLNKSGRTNLRTSQTSS